MNPFRNPLTALLLTFSAIGCAGSPGDGTQAERSGSVSQRITTVSSLNRLVGDFNGDGIADAIVVTPTEATEYLGVAGGGFSAGWSDPTITDGSALYIGDFNGDGASDFIAVDNWGSSERLGTKGPLGGFSNSVWGRSDLTLGTADYVVGDFNGDQSDDVIIVTAGGSYEYTGIKITGGFNPNVWTRTDLKRGSTQYTVGNFNGDGADDVIISNQSGSYEYLGQVEGTFVKDVWVRPDLPYQLTTGEASTMYTVGDFNGDGADDVIISTPRGSFEYVGQKVSGVLTATSWQRTDLPFTNGNATTLQFTPGYFNGDRFEDVLIATSEGVFEYAGSSGVLGYTGYQLFNSSVLAAGGSYTIAVGDFTRGGVSDLLLTMSSATLELVGEPGSGFQWAWTSYALLFPNAFFY